MSLLWTLRRFVDPEQAAEEEARRRRGELPIPEKDSGEGNAPIRVIEPPQRTYQCRLCGHRSSDPEFCSQCLAGTMKPV